MRMLPKPTRGAKMTTFFLVAAILVLIQACSAKDEQLRFRQLPQEGWDANQVIELPTDPVRQEGDYEIYLILRGTSLGICYPYQSITILAEQQWLPRKTFFRDTIVVSLSDENGNRVESLKNYVEYQAPTGHVLHLNKGDEGVLRIRHLMVDDKVPGFSHVGYDLIPQ